VRRLGSLVLSVAAAVVVYIFYGGGLESIAPVEHSPEQSPVWESEDRKTGAEKGAAPAPVTLENAPSPARSSVHPEAEPPRELAFDEALAFAREMVVGSGEISLKCAEGTEAKPFGEYTQCLGADGRRHGLYLRKNQQGRLRQRGYFRADKRWGAFVSYDGEGRATKVTEWRNNQMNGEDVAYFPDGSPARKMGYKDGKPHGAIMDFAKNGAQYALHTYADGKRYGRTWILKEGDLSFVSGGCFARGDLIWAASDAKEARERACNP
jgi:hypothetical protein